MNRGGALQLLECPMMAWINFAILIVESVFLLLFCIRSGYGFGLIFLKVLSFSEKLSLAVKHKFCAV